jgi:DNA end-binding protein Ku
MARPLWKGHISFGLVSIPVTLFPGDRRDELSFELLDERDLAPVGYRKFNKNTGEEVPADRVARGFRLDDGRVVLITDEDLKKASPERTETIEIRAFVDAAEVPPAFFSRPYCLEPTPAGEKGYVLLREAMRTLKKAAVGVVVLRARQHLALLVPDGPWLRMLTLRYVSELRDPKDFSAPRKSAEDLGINERESKLAQRLVEEMTEPWKPDQYHDQYRDDLLASIAQKAEAGQGKAVPGPAPAGKGEVIDLMSLLKRSLSKAGEEKPRRGKTG